MTWKRLCRCFIKCIGLLELHCRYPLGVFQTAKFPLVNRAAIQPAFLSLPAAMPVTPSLGGERPGAGTAGPGPGARAPAPGLLPAAAPCSSSPAAAWQDPAVCTAWSLQTDTERRLRGLPELIFPRGDKRGCL